MRKNTRQFRLHAAPSVEELFLTHYEQMFEWALHLTGHDHARTEDLVHDVFVQLRLGSQDFAAIENVEAYLFTVLRNLHRSQLTRAQRSPANPSLLVEYDSVEAGLQALHDDAGQRLETLEELRAICQFVCVRKETAKAASALILRFFHGYYPSEMAQMLCASRQAVAELLRVARAEAKVFLLEPQRLSFLSAVESLPELEPLKSEKLTEQLRQAIFATRQGECLPLRHLEDLYLANRAELIDAPKLAHFVSCANCLESINRLLKLPSLDHRDPPEMLGPDPNAANKPAPPKTTAFKAKRNARASWQKLERRWRDVYEHDPTALRIAVNGEVLSSHKLHAAERNELSLSIEAAHETLFIEIFSEQGVRLLFFHAVAPPSGAFEQFARATFSDNRTLEARLNFCGSWPHLEITYECSVQNAERGASDCGLQIADDGFVEEVHSSPPFLGLSADSQGLLDRLRSAFRNPQSAIRWLLRPITITILLSALLITVVVGQKLGWWFAPAKPKTAPTKPDARPGKINSESQPSSSPSAQPKVSSTSPAPSPVASPAVAPTATAALEIEALRLLQQAKADTHEQIEVRRTPAGKLRIEGILETDARKTELLQALSSLRTHPAVELQLQTVAEAARRLRASPASPAIAIEREEITVTKLPVDAELRRHFTSRGVAVEQIDNEIEGFAAATLQRSRQMARHAGALRQLAGRFSAAQLQSLDAATRATWLSLLHSHARSLRDETLQLRASLAPALSGSGASVNEINSLNNDEELRRACERVAQLCAESDLMVRAAFTVSANAAPVGVRSATFFTTLHRIEHLAEAISAAR
jgi:RNA polymerase sigma factor (sigma-70 family)